MLDPDPKKTITVDALTPDQVTKLKVLQDMPASDFHEEAKVDIYYHDEENMQDTQEGNADTSGDSIDV